MVSNLLLALLLTLICLAIQCLFIGIALRFILSLERRKSVQPTVLAIPWIIAVFSLILLSGNMIQMFVWAASFRILGEFGDFPTAFYHSVVNFSTLGYGDVLMSPERRLLGALQGTNGVFMFGLTTSVIFVVLQKLTRKVWDARQQQTE